MSISIVNSTTYAYDYFEQPTTYIQGSELNDLGDWLPMISYVPGDVITFEGALYFCVSANTGLAPTANMDDNWTTLIELSSGTSASSPYLLDLPEVVYAHHVFFGTGTDQVNADSIPYSNPTYTTVGAALTVLFQGTAGATTLSSLTDVSIPAPVAQDVLVYNGTLWTASGALVTEQGTRSQADQYLQNQFTVETGTRSQADQDLQNQINIEQGTRSQADQDLQNQLTNLSLTAGSIKAVVNAGLTGQSLVGATSAGTVSINSLVAGPGISVSSGADSVLISSGTQTEIGYEDALALEVFQDYATGTLPTLNHGIGWDGPAYALGHSIAVTTNANNQQTKRLVLAQGEYARKFAWGRDWAKMRLSVGVRFNGTIAPTSAQLYIGICSGTEQPYTAGSTLDWVGGGYDGAASYLTTPAPLVGFTFSPFLSKRYGVPTSYGQGVGSAGKCFSSTGTLVSVLMAEIIRTSYTGTQNYSIAIQSATQAKVALNAAYSTLLHTGRLHDVNAGGWGDSAGYTVASYNDAAGPHNAMSLVYTGAVPLEIAYICATRIY